MGGKNDFFNRMKKIRFKIEMAEVVYILIIVMLGLFIIYIF